MTVSDFKLSL